MEKFTIEEALLERLDNCQLESNDTGGLSNEALWNRISEKQGRTKIVAFSSGKKALLLAGLGLSFACAAMYSGYTYFSPKQASHSPAPAAKSTPAIHEAIEPTIVQAETTEESDITASAPAIAEIKPSSARLTPQTEPTITPAKAEDVTLSAPATNDTEIAQSIQQSNEVLQEEKDTIVPEKKVVYLKPDPVKVQAPKVKYVKKKRKRKE